MRKRTQWSDYIERVLDIVTINRTETNNVDDGVNHQVFNQDTYSFRICCDIQLTMVSSGYVYILVSLRHPNYTYIGTTKCIRTRLQMHNSGNGAIGTAPAYLRPFALLAYICGFTSDSSDLRFHTENKWKEKRDFLISQGDNDVKSWVLYCGGNQVISDVCENTDVRFSVERNEKWDWYVNSTIDNSNTQRLLIIVYKLLKQSAISILPAAAMLAIAAVH